MFFPRTPEAVVKDNGGNSYTYLTPVQDSGDVDYAVVPVDDQGQPMAMPAIAADSPVTILNPPAPPTGLSVTGTAAALTVHWTLGTAGSTYRCYRSLVNAPTNFGSFTTPAMIETAVDATSQLLTAITDYAPIDQEPDYDDLTDAWDLAVGDFLTAFAAGETGFSAAIDLLEAELDDAIVTFRTAIRLNVLVFRDNVANIAAALRLVEAQFNSGGAAGWSVDTTDALQIGETLIPLIGGTGTFAPGSQLTFSGDGLTYSARQFDGAQLVIQGGLETAIAAAASITVTAVPLASVDWASAMAPAVADTLAAIGATLENNPGRYVLPGYGLPINPPAIDFSLLDCVTPFILPGFVRICVRAKLSGIEEQTNTEIQVEFDAAGAIVTPRPNAATINAPLHFSAPLVFSADVAVTDDGAAGVATIIDVYVVPNGTPFDFTTPTVSATIPAIQMGYAHVECPAITVGGAGYYDITALARTAAGARSRDYTVLTEYIGNDTPNGALNVSAQITRSRGG